MIKIDWKDAKKETPSFTITEGKKYSQIEMVWCLVSDGESVWDTTYDPTEGWNEDCIIRFIEIKSIRP